jgi:hypothetical protein
MSMNTIVLRRWLELPRSPSFLIFVFVTLVATFGLAAKLTELGQPLKPYKIVALQFAWTPEKAKAVLSDPLDGTSGAWRPERLEAARQSLLWDFPFLLAYAPFLAAMVLLAAQHVSKLYRLNVVLSLAPFVAAALDAIENVALLRVLAQSPAPSAWLLQLAALAAGAKFALVIAAALYVPGVGVYRLLVREPADRP